MFIKAHLLRSVVVLLLSVTLVLNMTVVVLADGESRIDERNVETSEEEQEWLSLGTIAVSGYCPCVSCCGEWSEYHWSRQGTGYVQKTKSGTIPTADRTVGVAKRLSKVIPLGSTIKIGEKEYIVEDTGSSNSKRLDIYFDTHTEAADWGLQKMEVLIRV